MSARSFNAKKTWDTGKNYSKHLVKQAQERRANELRKLEELKRQVDEERELEALHLARYGNTDQLKLRKLDWMYQAPMGATPAPSRGDPADADADSSQPSSGGDAAAAQLIAKGTQNKLKAPVFDMALGTGLAQPKPGSQRADLLARINAAAQKKGAEQTQQPIRTPTKADEWRLYHEDPLHAMLARRQKSPEEQIKAELSRAKQQSNPSSTTVQQNTHSLEIKTEPNLSLSLSLLPPPPSSSHEPGTSHLSTLNPSSSSENRKREHREDSSLKKEKKRNSKDRKKKSKDRKKSKEKKKQRKD